MAENCKQNGNRLITGVIWREVLIFFVPLLLGAFLQQLYNTADAMIVGRFVGPAALSAVGGTTGQILNLIIGFFLGLSSGAMVIISQFFGGGRRDEVNRTIHASLALSLAGGAVLTVLGVVSAPTLLRLLNTPEEVMGFAVPYLRIYFAGTVANLLYNMGSGILRAVGDSKSPLWVLLACTVVNVLLDLLFVGVFHMDTAGAAIATVLSQLFSAVLVLLLVHKKGEGFRLSLKRLRFDPPLLRRVTYIGLPAGIQAVLYSLSNLIIQAGVNAFGTNTIAAWTVFGKIDSLFWIVVDSFGVAVTTFISQNYGAQKLGRVKKGVNVCLVMCAVMIVFLSAVLYVLSGPLTHLFTDDPEVIAMATRVAHFQILFFWTWTCIQVYSCVLRAVGDSIVPMVFIALGVCGLRVAWVLLVAPLLPHVLEYTVSCYQISWAVTSLLFAWYYYRKAPVQQLLRGVRPSETD